MMEASDWLFEEEPVTMRGLHGGVVASTAASQQEGRGFNSRCGRSFCVEAACSPRGFSGFSGFFLPQSKDMQQVT